MKRLLLIVTAALALVVCGMARANYQYGSGFDDQFDRKSNDLRHFDHRPFDRNLYDFRWFDDRDNYRRSNEWWFDSDRQYFEDRPFDSDLNDLRYFDTGLIV
jgi:hypothetical protein